MWTEAELPDGDYASLYGHAALHQRMLARLDGLLRSQEQAIVALDQLAAKSDQELHRLERVVAHASAQAQRRAGPSER